MNMIMQQFRRLFSRFRIKLLVAFLFMYADSSWYGQLCFLYSFPLYRLG